MSFSKGAFGETVIEVDGSTNGIQRRVMRPKDPPYVMVEVIDGVGCVSAQRTGLAERFWREHLEGQGGPAEERIAKGRKDANRVVVAILNGPGALSGEKLQAERRKHGYEVIPNAYGLANCYEGQVTVRDRNSGQYIKVEGCGRGIKILDRNSVIAQRREVAEREITAARAQRLAQNMSTANAAAAILTRGTAPPAADDQELRARIAKLEAALAAKDAPTPTPTPTPVADASDEDAPAPPTSRKGK